MQESREYQIAIGETAKLYNTLVVLPTGLGKTHIAMMLAKERISQYPKSKVIILAPTKPLVEQHASTFSYSLPDAESLGVVLTGKISPEKRAKQFKDATYIFSTPQTIENDLLSKRISLKDVSLLVVDEAHRATGDYAYVYIVSQYQKHSNHERILALTASPGADKKTIEEIIANVGAEKVEVRTPQDDDVQKYVQETQTSYLEVDLPEEFEKLKTVLDRILVSRLSQVKQHGHIRDVQLNKTQLLLAQKQLQRLISDGDTDPLVWRSISILAEVMKAQHALELLETQGLKALLLYMQQMNRQAAKGQSKAVKNLMSDPEMKHVLLKTESLVQRGVEHPKLIKLISLAKLELTKNPQAKIIIFSQYRDMANQIVQKLPNKAQLFVGQQKKGGTGLSQKEQQAMLDEFRVGSFPILVATAVGEEGLDIPAVDLVVFYEPIPSAIRTIQRRGRTGRHDKGRVLILVARGTRDVGYRWSAHHKEKRMYRALEEVAKNVSPKRKIQHSLTEFKQDEITVYADAREKGSAVLKELQSQGANLVLKKLDVGDYLLSKRVAVEFKTAEDFVNSILDGRLMDQLTHLTQYQRPVVIVQGKDWYAQRNVHPNAIRGALSAISVSFGVPILSTQNEKDTAALLMTIAKREQDAGVGGAEFASKHSLGTQAEILAVASSLPGIGPLTGEKLLKRFGNLKELFQATEDELTQVEGIGKKRAKELVEFFQSRFE